MTAKPTAYNADAIESFILVINGQRVILDADLAAIYGVTTRRLNEQVKRNLERFPSDFAFRLTQQEVANLKSQFATSSTMGNGSQIATRSGHGGRRNLPLAFTEHGAVMAANLLNSPSAVRMSVFVVRAFIRMRKELFGRAEMEKRLLQVEKVLLAHDQQIRDIYEKIRPLLLPPPEPHRRKIGFSATRSPANFLSKRGR